MVKSGADLPRNLKSDLRLKVLHSISTAVAQARDVDSVLRKIVTGLAEEASCALARVWLVGPGDICGRCDMRAECPDQQQCLHLAASAGTATNPQSGDRWLRMDGDFQRFPLGVRVVGRIASTGEPEHFLDTAKDDQWIGRDDWLRRENVRSFVGHPLRFRGEVLGVLGVFTREPVKPKGLARLGLFADQAAIAIANARAFGEIERLQRRLELENEYLKEEIDFAHGHSEIVGQSPALKKVLDQIGLVGPADTTALIHGESGTGKELIARAIHAGSRRKVRAMVTVSCASTPRELLESELFGHVKGAFKGAIRDRVGRFQLADGGTLFLEEVGEIPLELQGKLLRVLQERTFERIGEERTRKVDVRVIAATNRDLEREVEEGRFREDLYYGLSMFPLEVAPLRERLDDVPLLAAHFLEQFSERLNVPAPKLKRRHVEALQGYAWPGNVRELRNVIERALILARSGRFELDLPGGSADRAASAAKAPAAAPRILQQADIKRLERKNLLAALKACRWRVYGPKGAARLLGMKPTTLSSRIGALGLREG